MKDAKQKPSKYRAVLRFNDGSRIVRGTMQIEPLQTDPEPHEGHRACQKRFADDAHTIANMGGMLNEAEALLRDWLALTNETHGDTIERTYQWGRGWSSFRKELLR